MRLDATGQAEWRARAEQVQEVNPLQVAFSASCAVCRDWDKLCVPCGAARREWQELHWPGEMQGIPIGEVGAVS